jgi:nitrogen fixation protein FixH
MSRNPLPESRSPAAGNRPGGKPGWNAWPVAIMVFFAVAIAACAAFVAFCVRNPSDLVAEDYYEQELRYGKQMERIQRANEAGRPASVVYDAGSRLIVISLPADAAAGGATGEVRLYRPSAAALDRHLKLDLKANSTQEIDAAGLQPGLWRVKISWNAGGREYFLEKSVRIES